MAGAGGHSPARLHNWKQKENRTWRRRLRCPAGYGSLFLEQDRNRQML